MIDKSVWDKGFIWNPSNCECECDKSYNIGEYLDYSNCKCRKKLVDKLIDECNETIEEVKLAKITPFENGSCIVYIVFMIVVFTISIGITVYLVYYNWSLIKFNTHKETVIWWVQLYKMGTVKQINVKNRTYYFYNDIIELENFASSLLKIDKKSYKDISIYNIGYITIKKLVIVKIFTMWILCIYVLITQADISKKKV